MEKSWDGVYSQGYYSDDYFLLYDLLESETVRLFALGIKVVDYKIFIPGERNGFFYIYLYFRGINKIYLEEKNIFNNLK